MLVIFYGTSAQTSYHLSSFDSCGKSDCKKALRELWERESLFLVGPLSLEVWLEPSGG